MTPSEDRPAWGSDTGASASGGHLPPEGSTGSSFDPLTAPLSSETTQEPTSRRSPEAPPSRRRRPVARRLKRTVRHVSPVSVLKLSLFFYSVFLVIWLIVVAVIFSMLSSMGLFDTIEELADAFALQWDAEISLFLVERWAFMIGLTFVVIGSLINVFLAFLYNVAADTIGGVEMTFVERDV